MEETFIEVVSTVKVICGVKSLVVLDVTVRVTRLSALAITTCVYDGCGFRSCVLSPWPKRNIKTKLQINTSPAAGINTLLPAGHFVHRDVRVSPYVFYFSNFSAYTNLCRYTPDCPRTVFLYFFVGRTLRVHKSKVGLYKTLRVHFSLYLSSVKFSTD